MPEVKVVNLGKRLRVGHGANLRKALLINGVSPYKGIAKVANCHGFGTCGTCTVDILRGETNEMTWLERLRSKLGKVTPKRRLSCQVTVYGDIEIDTLTESTAATAESSTDKPASESAKAE